MFLFAMSSRIFSAFTALTLSHLHSLVAFIFRALMHTHMYTNLISYVIDRYELYNFFFLFRTCMFLLMIMIFFVVHLRSFRCRRRL